MAAVCPDLRGNGRILPATVYDHLQRLHSTIEGIREMLATAIQSNLGMINLNETEVTKKLAGWAAIIAVPTLIAGSTG